jgi:hypothetical protein
MNDDISALQWKRRAGWTWPRNRGQTLVRISKWFTRRRLRDNAGAFLSLALLWRSL